MTNMESGKQSTEDNADQKAFWNGAMGDGWVKVEAYIDRIMSPMTDVALARLAPKAGERIIDVGCGCGGTSRAIGASGATVWGIDISDKMIRQAELNAQGVDNVSFSVADAAHEQYSDNHDAIFSRYGVMFFADPVAAFRNLRKALVPGGRLVYLCWQSPSLNPWIATGIGGIEKQDGTGNIDYTPENHEHMVHLRQAKIDAITADIPPTEVVGDADAEVLVLGWGSTWAAIDAAVQRRRRAGVKVAKAHITHLNPLPPDLGDLLHRFEKVLVPELNMGQLAHVIRGRYLVDATPVTKVQGLPFKSREIEAAIDEAVAAIAQGAPS